MKRVCVLLMAVLCLLVPLSVSAASADAVKVYELTGDEQGGSAIVDLTGTTAFWEYPVLDAGQCRVDGSLRFVNRTAQPVQLGMLITLPYDNEAALGYLNYVRIRVTRQDGTVVYDGPYCRIADGGRLDDGFVCASQEAVQYDIALWCAYDYAGSAAADSSGIAWQLATSVYLGEPDREQAPATPSEVWVLGVLVAGLAVLALCLVPRLIKRPKRSRRKRR